MGHGVEGFNWKEAERRVITRALVYYRGNLRRACQALGYGSVNTLRSKMISYDISFPR